VSAGDRKVNFYLYCKHECGLNPTFVSTFLIQVYFLDEPQRGPSEGKGDGGENENEGGIKNGNAPDSEIDNNSSGGDGSDQGSLQTSKSK
jgi:hypothetical protein